jgi:hypothetical protein
MTHSRRKVGAIVLENADRTRAATGPRIHPRYRPVALAKLDQRTKEARLIRETRAALVAHVGGKPSAVQAAMIERACQLTLRIVAMDRKFAETCEQTDHDSRTYLAWSNSLSGHVFLPCAHALLLGSAVQFTALSVSTPPPGCARHKLQALKLAGRAKWATAPRYEPVIRVNRPAQLDHLGPCRCRSASGRGQG